MTKLFDLIAIQHAQKLGKAIDHKERQRIIEFLEKHPASSGVAIHAHMKIDRNFLTKHMADLRKVGLIKSERQGTSKLFSLNKEYINSINKQFQSLSKTIEEAV